MNSTNTKGFTLVELMLGVVAASILALAAGGMLAIGYNGWVRSMAVADMESELSVTVHALDIAVRGGSNAVGGASLTVSSPSWGSRVFTSSGTSPRKTLLCDGMILVNGRLESFSSAVSGNVVSVNMALAGIDKFNQDTGVRMGFTNLYIRMRN